jgi:hypothetical protein
MYVLVDSLALNVRACNLSSSPAMDVTVGKLDAETSVISAYLRDYKAQYYP